MTASLRLRGTLVLCSLLTLPAAAGIFDDLKQQVEKDLRNAVTGKDTGTPAPANSPQSQPSAHDADTAAPGGHSTANVPPVTSAKSAVQDSVQATSTGSGGSGNHWRILKVGESAEGVSYRRNGSEAAVYFDQRLVTKCVESRDSPGADPKAQADVISASTISVSPPSPQGKYAAVVCVDPDWGGMQFHILNLKNRNFYAPQPQELVALLGIWIGFSPDDRHAVLNQAGDEGNYTTLVLDLENGQASILDAPLFPESVRWLNERTVLYQVNGICDDDSDDTCKAQGIYDFKVDILSKNVKRTRVGDMPPETDTK